MKKNKYLSKTICESLHWASFLASNILTEKELNHYYDYFKNSNAAWHEIALKQNFSEEFFMDNYKNFSRESIDNIIIKNEWFLDSKISANMSDKLRLFLVCNNENREFINISIRNCQKARVCIFDTNIFDADSAKIQAVYKKNSEEINYYLVNGRETTFIYLCYIKIDYQKMILCNLSNGYFTKISSKLFLQILKDNDIRDINAFNTYYKNNINLLKKIISE